jgi:hypothetical protein
MMLTYVETAIAFTLVMLAAALMVNVLVRIHDQITHARAKGVQAMLRQLYRGYLHQQRLTPPPNGENHFVHDVLSAPILHSEESYGALDQVKTSVESVLGKPAVDARDALAKAHASIEYILLEDLVAIIDGANADEVRDWLGDPPVPPEARLVALGLRRQALSEYVHAWFTTAAATASNQFGKVSRRKAMSIAAIVVVLLNLDAIRLAYDLYRDRALDARIAQHVDDMSTMAQRLDATAPERLDARPDPAARDQLHADLQKTMALFSIERVPLGWNDSYISKRWCKFRDDCDDPTVDKPTRSQLTFDIAYWLMGLFAAWLMISLGAPFWVQALETLTGIKDRLKPPKGKSPGSNPWPASDDGDDPPTATVATTTTTTPDSAVTTTVATGAVSTEKPPSEKLPSGQYIP